MLITFTTEHGNLIIRSEDLRRLEDEAGPRCRVEWAPTGAGLHFQYVTGTALDNYARIMQEEAKLIAAYEAAQRMAQTPPQDLRYTRGGKVKVPQ